MSSDVPPVDLPSLIGVWTRRAIKWPDGREDQTTRVIWLQGQSCFADIRIPVGRPIFAGVQSLLDCDIPQQTWLGSQAGFAGVLEPHQDAWLWKRELDFRPPSGKRDIGRLIYQDASRRMMIEEGVDEPYTEIWERIDDAASTAGGSFAMRYADKSGRGFFIAVGENFLLARDHRTLPAAGLQLVNCELSHGIRKGPLHEWTIANSTFPWREGQRAFAGAGLRLDWTARVLHEGSSRIWTILEPASGSLEWLPRTKGDANH